MSYVELQTLGGKSLQQAANLELLAYCPSMDLLAVGTVAQEVQVYRLNGQQVHGVSQKDRSINAQKLAWKPNGWGPLLGWEHDMLILQQVDFSP